MLQWVEQPGHSLFFYPSIPSNSCVHSGSLHFTSWALIGGASPSPSLPGASCSWLQKSEMISQARQELLWFISNYFLFVLSSLFLPQSPKAFPAEMLQPGRGVEAFWGCWAEAEEQWGTAPTSLHGDAVGWMTAPADKPLPSPLSLHHFDLDFDTASLPSPNIMGKEIIHIWKTKSLTKVKSNLTEAGVVILSLITELASRTVNFDLILSL